MKNRRGQFVFSVTVGEKGQIVIPKQLRDNFGIVPGDSLLLFSDKKKGIAIPPKDALEDISGAVFGYIDGGNNDERE